jgi:hypothetical protein
MINRVLGVNKGIEAIEEEGNEALLVLFRKRVATPENLDALLCMIDTDIQTGKIRCIAFKLLYKLVDGVDYSWGLKMEDGSYFATSCIVACCKALENETNEDCNNRHTERSCTCALLASSFLNRAIVMTKDGPVTVIERVHAFNWDQILSKANKNNTEAYNWFVSMYFLCLEALKENAEHFSAQKFLEKLEMCHDFYCGALEHLVRMARSLSSLPKEEIGKLLSRLTLIRNALRIYSTRLTPPPTDPKTKVLVRLAQQTLKEGRPTAVAALQDPTVEMKINFTIEDYDELLLHTDAHQWAGLKTLSDSQRRERFEAELKGHPTTRKTLRRGAKKFLKNAAEQSFGNDEMCASCYVLESKLGEGEQLSKCGWCKQVTYCSRECQKLHWNKAHKEECDGRKK